MTCASDWTRFGRRKLKRGLVGGSAGLVGESARLVRESAGLVRESAGLVRGCKVLLFGTVAPHAARRTGVYLRAMALALLKSPV